jgi:hypothetical protein
MQNTNTKLFTALIIVIGLAAGYVYYSQVIVLNEIAVPPPAINSRDDLSGYKNLRIDFSIFDNAAYKALAIFGQVPVSPGVTGKKDVFAP